MAAEVVVRLPIVTPEITGEMTHAIFLAEKIASLGGKPTTVPKQHKCPKDVKSMLKKADRALDGLDDSGPITAVGVLANGLF